MHPDLKVGLALAMLIVGFAGAMCFRHRPMDAAALHDPLPSDATLDAEMELLPVRTYTPRPEESDSEHELIAADPAAELLSTGDLQIPEPIATAQDDESSTPDSVDPNSTASATTTYVVKSGDTLSGIASRLLGSTQRYVEIFEANRHQLNSPNDLKLGMVLVIPPKDPVVATEPAPAAEPPAGSSESATANEEPTPATVQRFTPIVPR